MEVKQAPIDSIRPLAVVWKPIADIKPSAKNARKHNDEQVALLAASIKQWGWTFPILIDEQGEIIAGEGRWLAAKKLRETQIPCLVAKDWAREQIDAYRIADNQLSLRSSWDYDEVLSQLSALDGAHFDLSLLGFDQEFLDGMLSVVEEPPTESDPEDAAMLEMIMEGDEKPYHHLIVRFRNAADIAEFGNRLELAVTNKTRSLWFPERARKTYQTQAWKEKNTDE